jgi:phosphoserine phosphatase
VASPHPPPLVATLVAAGALSPGDVATASDALRAAGGEPGAVRWIDAGDAADLPFVGLDRAAARAAIEAAMPTVDVVVQPVADRAKRLLIADMDSTLIECECIDELADYAGLKAEVAAITDAAMNGRLDFVAALDARVALLAGMDVAVLDRCRRERVRFMPGAATLVATMRARGARTILVSGGFTAFADPVGRDLGFDRIVANRLLVADGRLTGSVARPVVDSGTKRAELIAAGVPLATCLAVGDGANDIPMLTAAGLGIAYHAKATAAAAADVHVRIGDLTALLWAQGYPRSDWCR